MASTKLVRPTSMTSPAYLHHLKQGESLLLSGGVTCEMWELNVPNDATCLSEWSSRFRQTYCPDSDIDILRSGTGKSRAEYLLDLVFPDKTVAPGPGVRSGDFAELLVSDYVEFILGYWVPRGKYGEKGSRNESVKGVDIVGFKCPDAGHPKATDEMLTFEAKAQLGDGKYKSRLQDAVDDSGKDYLRAGETLAAMKRRMHIAGDFASMQVVERFQNVADRPFRFLSGAAAILSDSAFDADGIKGTKIAGHNNAGNLRLITVKGKDLMTLAHALYQRAADEA
ncbi:virulence associated protein [Roseateles sp. BYS96W]|uniref:Virulence associated protein n=1 Tax=Pelomonas nitida TaxID=3299027 RepID=A0ABW7GBQ6_9BURK